jgi:hypothetical protein
LSLVACGLWLSSLAAWSLLLQSLVACGLPLAACSLRTFYLLSN